MSEISKHISKSPHKTLEANVTMLVIKKKIQVLKRNSLQPSEIKTVINPTASGIIIRCEGKADLLEFLCGVLQLLDNALIGYTEKVRVQVEALLDVAFGLGQVRVGPV